MECCLAGPAYRASGGAVASSLRTAQVSDTAVGQVTGCRARAPGPVTRSSCYTLANHFTTLSLSFLILRMDLITTYEFPEARMTDSAECDLSDVKRQRMRVVIIIPGAPSPETSSWDLTPQQRPESWPVWEEAGTPPGWVGASRCDSEASPAVAGVWRGPETAGLQGPAGPCGLCLHAWRSVLVSRFESLTVQSNRCARSVLTVSPRTPRTQQAVGVPTPERAGPLPGGQRVDWPLQQSAGASSTGRPRPPGSTPGTQAQLDTGQAKQDRMFLGDPSRSNFFLSEGKIENKYLLKR